MRSFVVVLTLCLSIGCIFCEACDSKSGDNCCCAFTSCGSSVCEDCYSYDDCGCKYSCTGHEEECCTGGTTCQSDGTCSGGSPSPSPGPSRDPLRTLTKGKMYQRSRWDSLSKRRHCSRHSTKLYLRLLWNGIRWIKLPNTWRWPSMPKW